MRVLKSLAVLLLTVICVTLAASVRPSPEEAPLTPLLFLPLFAALFLCRFGVALALGIALSLVTLWLGVPSGQAPWSLSPLSTPVIQAALFPLIALGGGLAVRQMKTSQRNLALRLQNSNTYDNALRWVEASDSLEDGVDIVLLALEQTHSPHAVLLYTLDKSRNQLILQGARGAMSARVQARAPEDIATWGGEDALSTTHFIPNRSASSCIPLASLIPGAQSGLVLPLFQADCRLEGLLVLAHNREVVIPAQELEALRDFVKEVALALERIRSREDLLGMAFTDALTDLKNYRAFREDLKEELRRAERYRHPVSLLILDLDSFKLINDRYGHLCGNQMLRHIAQVLQDNLRDTDHPARYGGEEFVALCPETGESEAVVVAERIRRAVQDRPFPIGTETVQVTVSVGVATFPIHAKSEVDLIEQADAALYRAKEGGRNRVVVASAPLPKS